MADDLPLPNLPAALTAGASVADMAETVAPRPWGNDGQASVSLLTLTLSGGERRQVVWKRARVPRKEKRRKAEADKRLASFEAEAAFFDVCAPRLSADTAVPRAWHVSHSTVDREFQLVMSNLKADGFTEQPDELGLGHARRALEWLANLHAQFWSEPIPAGLWSAGSYWNLGKTSGSLGEARMASNLRAIQEADSYASLVPRLFHAAVPLDAALHAQRPSGPQAAESAPRRAPKRRAAALSGEEDVEAAAAVRLPLHHTVIHGDAKCENLFFAPDGRCAACDFQWVGRGVGSLDVIYLLTASLADGLLPRHEAALLGHYHDALCHQLAGADAPAPSWRQLELEYNLATLDFARFVLADAPLIDTDAWLLERTAALLTRLDGGEVRSAVGYAQALRRCADASAPDNPLTGVVAVLR